MSWVRELWTGRCADPADRATLSAMALRPALRPGALLLRRDASHLQVGTSPGIVIADRPGLLALMRLMDGTRDVARLQQVVDAHVPELTGPVSAVVTELRAVGAVFDATRWSAPGRRGLDDEARHADLAGRDPDGLARRTDFRLAVRPDAAGRPLADAAGSILSAAGVKVHHGDPDLVVAVSGSEPPRAELDDVGRQGLDHLSVVVDEDRVRIGPLVRPGRTPCLRCHDLHRADWDDAWPALLHQVEHGPTPVTAAALDALTVHAAALELAAEVLALVDGEPTRTSGQCLVVGPGHASRALWPVTFHHACACDLLSAA